MRIKIGDRFRDYVNTLYVVKEYKNQTITFEVDNGKMKDEVYTKKEFMSEIDGNRFHVDKSNEISDEEIEKAADAFEFTNGIYGFKQGVKWYREQLKLKK